MAHARRPLLAVSVLLAMLMLVTMPVASRSDGMLLVKVDKLQPRRPPAALIAQMEVIQELETAWLARIPESLAGSLVEAGISHEVLDQSGRGDVLFLVSDGTADDLALLRLTGAAWPLDSATMLLVADDERVRERVPPHLHLRRLPDRIDVIPTFRSPGQTAAVRRSTPVMPLAGGAAIPEMVGQVSQPALGDAITKLESFQTRYASLPACSAAGTWLFESFYALGLHVERDDFTFGGYNSSNIVATLPGRTAPEVTVVIGAHYDSYSNDATHLAPGADDNASGTAAVLEVARVLSRYPFDFTIQFVAFSAEEFGLYGSKHFAQEARLTGQKILGVINLDMIAYADRLPEDLDLVVNSRSDWLAGTFASAADTYAPLPTLKVVNASLGRSDHAPFWDNGYSALWAAEDANPTNPNYHKTYDSFGTLNMELESAATRASLAAVAALAQPFVSPPPPATVTARVQVLGTLFLRAKTAYVNWSDAPGAAGYNVYRSSLSRGPYQRVNRAVVTTTSFVDRFLSPGPTWYYVIASIDALGSQGNYSAEVTLR